MKKRRLRKRLRFGVIFPICIIGLFFWNYWGATASGNPDLLIPFPWLFMGIGFGGLYFFRRPIFETVKSPRVFPFVFAGGGFFWNIFGAPAIGHPDLLFPNFLFLVGIGVGVTFNIKKRIVIGGGNRRRR